MDNIFGLFTDDNNGDAEMEVLSRPDVKMIFDSLGLKYYAVDPRNKIRYYLIQDTSEPRSYETIKNYQNLLRTAYDTLESVPRFETMMTAVHLSFEPLKIEG